MQLNKVLKGLMLALPVLAVAACSSHKNNNNDVVLLQLLHLQTSLLVRRHVAAVAVHARICTVSAAISAHASLVIVVVLV